MKTSLTSDQQQKKTQTSMTLSNKIKFGKEEGDVLERKLHVSIKPS
jgi:hypothetical protein